MRVLLAAAACMGAVSLATAGGAVATGPTPVSCAGLEAAMNGASEGEVLELSESCDTNVNVTNTRSFTLEGDGSAVLSPITAETPIISSTTEGVRFALEGLVFKHGVTNREGGAVDVDALKEAVTLRSDTFLSNTALESGGAVLIEDGGQAASEPTVIEGDTFGAPGEGNKAGADALGGGAVELRVSGPLQITHNSFTDNELSNDFSGGGGLDLEATDPATATAPVEISDNTFTENRALDSGGGAFIEAGEHQTVTLEGNVFSANRVAGKEAYYPREGAGLVLAPAQFYEGTSFDVVQAHNTFTGNIVEATEATGRDLAAGGGGEWVLGVDVQSTADVFIENRVTVDEGQAPEGGGLGVLGTSTSGAHPQLASFTGVDDLFRDNSVAPGGWGGAIYTGFLNAGCSPPGSCAGTSLTLEDSTVYANEVQPGSASQGGALWGSANDSLAIENSIVFDNSPAPQIFGYATGENAPAFKYSDACQEAGGPVVPPGQGDICANPQLEADGEETLASPTVDAGSNGLVPAGLVTDLAGAPRIVATRRTCSGLGPAIVDMGAFEYQHAGPAPTCPTPEPVVASTAPVLANVSQSHRKWREGTRLASFSRKHKLPPLGTIFSFTLSEPANVSFAFTQRVGGRKSHGKCVAQTKKNRRKRGCKRTLIRGLLSFAGRARANKLSFQGRISRTRKLHPGSYTLVITATNPAGQRSAPKQLSFKILK
jgi:Right handed beta helix region